jgi:hypothetical protein
MASPRRWRAQPSAIWLRQEFPVQRKRNLSFDMHFSIDLDDTSGKADIEVPVDSAPGALTGVFSPHTVQVRLRPQ